MRPRELLARARLMLDDREAAESVGGWAARRGEIIKAMDASRPELEAVVGKAELDLMSRADIARVIARLPAGALRDDHLRNVCVRLTPPVRSETP